MLTERAVIEKVACVLANPVKAGLVERAAHWPGLTVLPQELGRKKWTVQRPDLFFDANNPNWPDEVELELTLPPSLGAVYEDGQIRDAVALKLSRQERLAREEVGERGWQVFGAERVR